MFIACGSAGRADPRVPVTGGRDPRLVQAQVHWHPPARAVRSRPSPFVSAGPFCRGSFALGTGRSPRRKPHVHCMWKPERRAGRPTGDPRAVVSPEHIHAVLQLTSQFRT